MRPIRRRIYIGLALLVFALTLFASSAVAFAAPTFNRPINNDTHVANAISLSTTAFSSGVPAAVVTSGDGYADSLTAAVLARAYSRPAAPVLGHQPQRRRGLRTDPAQTRQGVPGGTSRLLRRQREGRGLRPHRRQHRGAEGRRPLRDRGSGRGRGQGQSGDRLQSGHRSRRQLRLRPRRLLAGRRPGLAAPADAGRRPAAPVGQGRHRRPGRHHRASWSARTPLWA